MSGHFFIDRSPAADALLREALTKATEGCLDWLATASEGQFVEISARIYAMQACGNHNMIGNLAALGLMFAQVMYQQREDAKAEADRRAGP